jgi:HlyD family secretion protein
MSPNLLLERCRDLVRGRPVLVGAVALVVVVLLSFWIGSPSAGALPTAYYEVKRGDFTVSVVEGGNLAAVSEVSIRNEVEGTARIISIVPEGSYVKKGDLLVELDSAQAQDQVNQQQINYEKAVFAVEQARAQLEIQRSATNSDFLASQLKLKFAEIDRDKYNQGQRMVDLVEASNKFVSAQAQLAVNQMRLSNSMRLAAKGYETMQQVDSDRLTVLNTLNSMIIASNAIRMLSEFDVPKLTNKYSSDVLQAEQELERVVNQNLRRMAQYEADLSAQLNTLALSESKLARDRRNLTNCIIRAPQDGLVVYAVSDSHFSSESLIEGGATVRNRQELIKLPDLSRMKVNVKIHESHITMIRPGLPAYVVLDSMPDQRFAAIVERVAPLPDTQTRWGNPNLKVYNTEIYLTEPIPNVKPGVSAKAEIIITNVADALSVPIQAVTTHKGKQVVYVQHGAQPEPRPVETAMYNTKFIQITEGLEEGERVLLAPPFDLQDKDLEGAVLADEERSAVAKTNTVSRRQTAPQAPPDGTELGEAPPDGRALTAGGPGDAGGASAPNRDGRGRGMGFNREEMLKQFDKDGDGELDESEREAMRSAMGARMGQPRLSQEEMLKRFDKNGDGELDESERAAMREAFGGGRTNRTNRPSDGGEGRSPRPQGTGQNRPAGGSEGGGGV